MVEDVEDDELEVEESRKPSQPRQLKMAYAYCGIMRGKERRPQADKYFKTQSGKCLLPVISLFLFCFTASYF
jgi:hypothetical protein